MTDDTDDSSAPRRGWPITPWWRHLSITRTTQRERERERERDRESEVERETSRWRGQWVSRTGRVEGWTAAAELRLDRAALPDLHTHTHTHTSTLHFTYNTTPPANYTSQRTQRDPRDVTLNRPSHLHNARRQARVDGRLLTALGNVCRRQHSRQCMSYWQWPISHHAWPMTYQLTHNHRVS